MSFIEMLTGLELRVDRLIGSEIGDKISREYLKMYSCLDLIEVTPDNIIQIDNCIDQRDRNYNVHVRLGRLKEAYPIIKNLIEKVQSRVQLTQFKFHSVGIFYNSDYILHVYGSNVFELYKNRFKNEESQHAGEELTGGDRVTDKQKVAKELGINGMLYLINGRDVTEISDDTTLKNQRIITRAFFNLCSSTKFVPSKDCVFYDFSPSEFEGARIMFDGYLTSFGSIIKSAGQRPKPQP